MSLDTHTHTLGNSHPTVTDASVSRPFNRQPETWYTTGTQ